MDVGRLNFSHGKRQELLQRISLIRLLNAKYRRRVKLLGDLQGHRKRIKGAHEKIPFDYQGSLCNIKKGYRIFIDDGNIDLEVSSRTKNSLKVKVITGGRLLEHKGVNIPQARLKFGGISQKDIQDIFFCEKHGVEYISQSFVRTKKDILEVKRLLKVSSRCRVIAKIECREGIKNIDEIIKVSDGIMIARGDMGVSLPVYEIPVIQKMIIKKCNRAGKFVITATQMLESMVENLRPTRAEVTDVANAIIDGTDFVMLSKETSE